MVDSAGTLRIPNAQPRDAGQYQCTVMNDMGDDSQLTNVVIQEPPVILGTTLTNYTSVVGDSVEIRCDVQAYPPASVQWSRKGVPVTESTPGVRVEPDGTLVIDEVRKEDATFYTCRASNPAGKAEKPIFLSVISKTFPPRKYFISSCP